MGAAATLGATGAGAACGAVAASALLALLATGLVVVVVVVVAMVLNLWFRVAGRPPWRPRLASANTGIIAFTPKNVNAFMRNKIALLVSFTQ
jgi:hypothetical protein